MEIEMVTVPEGSFWMGSCEGYNDEFPIHKVYISKFMIGKFPVTRQLWEFVMFDNFEIDKLIRNTPITYMSYHDTREFIDKLNLLTGLEYRLPTEAEWEYACKGAGRDPFYGRYNLDRVAWFRDNSDRKYQEVGKKKPNILGIHDMLGTVLELCSDYGDENYYEISPDRNPKGPITGENVIIRGGSIDSTINITNSTSRSRSDNFSSHLYETTGFRLVRSI